MRLLALLCVLQVGLALGNDVFHGFHQRYSKAYNTAEEFEQRRSIFMENYNKMTEHNKRYEAGEVTWWQQVHEDMDLTDEEWGAKRLSGGLPHYDSNTKF